MIGPLSDSEFEEALSRFDLDRDTSPDLNLAPMRPEHPKHGEIVHYGFKTTTEKQNGYVVGAAMCSIVDTWCDYCKQWLQTNGVLGPLRFMAFHKHGDCHEDTTGG